MTTMSRADRTVLFATISCLLRYPDEALMGQLGLLEEAIECLPDRARKPLGRLAGHLAATPLIELQADYVRTFDLRHRNCLYLTYHHDGDTRLRGTALWRFADVYRRHGYTISDGELPDFLPAVLELASQAAPDDTEPLDLLVECRPGIALLSHSLAEDGSPYLDAIRALELALPQPDPAALEATRRLEELGPPVERVGLDPFAAIEPERVRP
jgi:nitrate reductase molybdenum cofactor assembly chaperone NarJ/NarW